MSVDLFQPFSEMKSQGIWPLPWTSAMGLVPYIRDLGDDIIGCEIGVSFGINLVYFLDNLPNIKKIIAIDPYIPYDDRVAGGKVVEKHEIEKVLHCFLNNIDHYQSRVDFLRQTSDQAASSIEDKSLDYVFIDGDHNYDFVIKDLINYYPKVKSGGIFAGHDVHSKGVQQALAKFMPDMDIDLNLLQICDHQTWFWTKP